MTDFIFLSVAFGERYIEQQTRLEKSIRLIYPSARHAKWTDCYPPGSQTHKESLYGFKPCAIEHALQIGYRKIIWLDTACILQQPVDYWFSLVKNYGVIAAKDDNKLEKCIGDKALNYFGNPDISDMHLVGGSLYVFDFDLPLCQKIFTTWEKAEYSGMFGSQAEQSSGKINSHRHDESCMAMALYLNGSEPVPCDVAKYNQGPDSIIIKDHFK
jgi:hypothetical protein